MSLLYPDPPRNENIIRDTGIGSRKKKYVIYKRKRPADLLPTGLLLLVASTLTLLRHRQSLD